MNYFLSIKAANAEIESLRAKLADAEAKAATQADESSKVSALLKERDDAAAEFHVKLTDQSNRIAALEQEAKTAGDRAADIVAGLGVKADKLPAADAPPVQTTLARAAFNQLSPVAQRDFCKRGGKITD